MNEYVFLDKYVELVRNPPKPGTILRTLSGRPVILDVKITEGKPPFISTKVYISEVLDDKLGWYLKEPDCPNTPGYSCILMTNARREVIKRCDISKGCVAVKSLKVVRPSKSGKSFLCEVHEYDDETVQHEED